MRLTRKLSLALALGVLVVLALAGVVRLRLHVQRFRDEVRIEHVALARAVRAVIETVAPREGEARAREIVERIDGSEPHAHLAWIAGASEESQSLDETSDTPRLVTRLPVALGAGGVVEVVEPLAREEEIERSSAIWIATTSSVVLSLCFVLILALGRRFVGQPLETLRSHARRVGAGERGLRTSIDTGDEIGDLAREMNVMARSLDEAAERARSEEATRLEMLEQLRHADRLRTVGELAAGVAHDLGTPMGAASARAQMIASGEVDAARARELAGLIVEEIERMSRSIRALLDHGRRDAPHLAPTDVAVLVGEVVTLLRPLAERRGVRLVFRDPRVAIEAELDASLVRQALVNLATNAIDASAGGSEVQIEVTHDADALTIAMLDRGPGVPIERRETIFEPFVTTKPAGSGTGLGLSVARGIALEQGGTLTVGDREGGGARFVLRLPSNRG